MFSYNLPCNINYVCFLYYKTPKLSTFNIHKEYAHLFLLLKNFLNCLHIHHNLIKFWYVILVWWNYKNPQKSFFFSYFLMRFKFIFSSTTMRDNSSNKNNHDFLMLFFLIMYIVSYCKIMPTFFSFFLKFLFVFTIQNVAWTYLFFLVYKLSRAIVRIFFSKLFQSRIFDG